MADGTARLTGWGSIIAVLLVFALGMGLLLGLLGAALGLRPGAAGAGVGASVGFLAAMLISRRRAALRKQAETT